MIIRATSFMIAATIAVHTISARTRKKRRHERETPGETEQRSCKQHDKEEMERMRLQAKDLRERKSALEKRLLELHDAKEEYRLMILLRRRLREKCSEVESLESRVRELCAERNVLEEEMRKGTNGAEELRSVRSVLRGLQEKIDSRKKEMVEMVRAVEERVDVVRRNDVRCDARLGIGAEEEDAVKDAEIVVLEFRWANKELELETREMAVKLDSAQAKISGLLSRIENEWQTVTELEKEVGMLRRVNEELAKRVDRLQKQRFGMVEQLVYMRWLNICLRFEAEEFHEISRKNPVDLPHRDNYRREWSVEYIEKTRRILRAVSQGSDSSQTSTESHGFDTSTTKSSASSSASKKRPTLIHRMKLWGRGKKNPCDHSPISDENATEGGRRIRRFSTSMIPERRATTESLDTAKGLSRLRRVSFDDAIRVSVPVFESSVTAPKATPVAAEPGFGTPTAETNDPEHQNISAEDSGGSSSDYARKNGHEQNQDQERAQAVEEVDRAQAEDVAAGTKISELCLVMVFLIFILILTFYYKIF